MTKEVLMRLNCGTFLEGILKRSREARCQQYLGRRYDARDNVIDWDYQMKLLVAVISGNLKIAGQKGFIDHP